MPASKQMMMITSCMDNLSCIPHASTEDKTDLIESIVKELDAYLGIEGKENSIKTPSVQYVLIAYNALELAQLENIPFEDAINLTKYCLEAALSFHID